MKEKLKGRVISDYIDTLDGFRALAAVLVMMFHYWQQSWVGMVIQIGSLKIDFTNIVVMGRVGVELLFILSGFCLYYPLAMHPERKLHIGNYVYKRCVRILPSYFLCVIISAVYQIGRMDPGVLWQQFLGNMTLTQMSTAALAYNRLNGVLWSIAIEVQFYILFPFILKIFRKKPYWVMLGALAIGEGWRYYLRSVDYSRITWLMNQLPGMIDAFVGGMLAAHITATLKRTLTEEQKKEYAPMFAVGMLMFVMIYFFMTVYFGQNQYENRPENMSRLQLFMRMYILIGFTGAITCSVFASRWVHWLLGNRLMRFVSGLTYQLYLWHMWIALRLKDFRIPAYATERPMDDPEWRFPYLMLSIGLSAAVSILMTYLYERPISRFALEHTPRWAQAKPVKRPRGKHEKIEEGDV